MKSAVILVMLLGCVSGLAMAQGAYRYMPNSNLTPGDTLDVARDDLCGSSYTRPSQKISVAMKSQVFDRYRISPGSGAYNVDHLIPASLGGSNSLKNLWPQPLSGVWTYQMKNSLERRLRKMVCSGAIALEKAQREIAADWVSAYKKYVTEPKQSPSGGRPKATVQSAE